MNRLLQIIVLCLLVCGCNFDRERQLSLALPATIVIKNISADQVEILEIYSTSEAHGAFALKGGAFLPGEHLSLEVSDSDYKIFVGKAYSIEVKCPSGKVLSVKGVDIVSIEKEDRTLELSLKACS